MSVVFGEVLPAGDPRLPGGFWTSGPPRPAQNGGSGSYGGFYGGGTIQPIGPAVPAPGGYTYQRLSNGYIAILRGTPPHGAVMVAYTGASSGVPAVVPGTQPWIAIDAQLKGNVAPPPAAVQQAVDQDAPAAAGGLLSQILATFGQGDPQKGASVAAQAVATYGPQVGAAIGSMLQNQGQSIAAMQRKLDSKLRDYAKAKQRGNTALASALAYEIKGLQAQIGQAQAAGLAAIPQYPAAPPDGSVPGVTTGFRWWIPAAILGGVVLVGGAFYLAEHSGQSTQRATARRRIAQVG